MRKFGRPVICRKELVGRNGQPVAYKFTPQPINKRLEIQINVANNQMAKDYWNSEYGEWLRDAQVFWQQCITGLRYTSVQQWCVINFDVKPTLQNNVLGIAGPGDGSMFTGVVDIGGLNNVLSSLRLYDGKYATPGFSTMHFSAAHYKLNPVTPTEIQRKEAFFVTAVHEMAHCLGFGLWNGDYRIVADMGILGRWKLPSFPTALTPAFPHNNVTTGDPHNVRYTGTAARNAWRETMVGQSTASGIYLENYGMKSNTTMSNAGATAGSHWKQGYHDPLNTTINGWTGSDTGIKDYQGRDMRDELMTGWSNSNRWRNTWVGKFTVAQFEDMGYTVNYLPLSIPLHEYRTEV